MIPAYAVVRQPKSLSSTEAAAVWMMFVGSLVGQSAKLKGARAVGIAGGPVKTEYLVKELGFDAAVDHRSPHFADQLAAATPDGIDVYFESVGGTVFDAVFPRLNRRARVPVCGLVSRYSAVEPPAPLPRSLMRAVLSNALTIRGFSVFDNWHLFDQFFSEVSAHLRDGTIRYREDIVDGFPNTPRAQRCSVATTSANRLSTPSTEAGQE